MRKSVREQQFDRTARDKGLRAQLDVRLYDTDLWSVNGEVCEDDLDAAEAVMAVLKRMGRIQRSRGRS